ncbi:MAG: FecR domain-containing protein [Candidatus Rokubacteria bacterium]|nr:FecR domain-containing protein [Candidatus Rokubacteria bacterium]
MTIKKAVAVTLIGALLSPVSAAAQAPAKAGVVTTLEGNVTARRVALPSPIPLKFKDDVLLQDTVTTGDKSLARMLLGGKAVVTVRERSTLTITEVPGRSTIELESGKFALAVAREKMRPGEEILIRTPNAVAGVRGTVVVTEVVRQGAQAGGGAPAVLTNFYVLRGNIFAQQLDPTSRQPVGAPLQVGTLQGYSQAGNAAPRVAPVPPEQVSQITSGLQPTGPKGGSDTGKEQVKAQALQAAVTLLGALNGGSFALATAAPAPTVSGAVGHDSYAPIITDVSGALDDNAALIKQIQALLTLLAQIFGNFTLTNQAARSFSGTVTSTQTTPLVTLNNATVLQFGDKSFFEFAPGSDVTLAGPLTQFVDSTLVTQGHFLAIAGKLTSTGTGALIDLDPSSVTSTSSALFDFDGATISLAGPLLTDVGGSLSVNGPVVTMSSSTLTSTSADPFVTLNGTTVTADAALTMSNSKMTLAGPLLKATSLSAKDATSATGPAIQLDNASSITSTGSGALIQLVTPNGDVDALMKLSNNSSVTLAGSFLNVNGTGSGTSSDPSSTPMVQVLSGSKLTGSSSSALVDLTNAATHSGLLAINSSSTTSGASVSLAGPVLAASGSTVRANRLLAVHGGGSLTGTGSGALLSLNNTKLTLSTSGSTPGDVLAVSGLNGSTFATVDLAGALLTASNGSALSTTGGLFHVGNGGKVTASTGTNPLVSLSGGTHTIGTGSAAMFQLTGRTTATASEVVDTPGVTTTTSTLTIGSDTPLVLTGSGAYLEASNSASISAARGADIDHALVSATAPLLNLKSGASLTTSSNGINLISNAKLTTTTDLVRIDNATLTVAGHAIRAMGGSFLNVSGDLFSLANGGRLTITSGGALLISGGAVVKINGGLINFSGTGNIVSITNSFTPGSCPSVNCGTGALASAVSFQNSATSAQVSISNNAIKNQGTNTLNVSGSAIIVDGTSAKLIISGQ